MKGTGVSPGISIGKAFIINKFKASVSGIKLKTEESKIVEIRNFDNAVHASVSEIETMKVSKGTDLRQADIDILETQIEFLNDPQIKSDVTDKINDEDATAWDAVIKVIEGAVKMFREMDDEYMSARAADIQDVGNRILRHLDFNESPTTGDLCENSIIIADDIAPSDTISLDISKVTGFATRLGGKTSHTAIIAKGKGIPAVVACGDELLNIRNDDIIILDGTTGEVIAKPDQGQIDEYLHKQKLFREKRLLLESIKDLPSKTTDGHMVKVYANISAPDDLEQVYENGGEGIGLLRTEMLFMGRDSFPSEEEQFQFYRLVAIKSKNLPVIIRTIDIGGDKQLNYFGIPVENNPFLGYRAIRICLDRKDIFMPQLRAILRASAFGTLKIMFPMICNVDEVIKAKECVRQAKNDLTDSGIKFDSDIELGIMIEIPSAALTADILAREVDFFSIGTNDLCQYTMAVDRMNDSVSMLYNHFNPGVLRLIQKVIEEAHKQGKQVGMCGEMASDPLATLLLLGMGLDEFSMSPASIPVIKNIIINHTLTEAGDILGRVMDMDNPDSITSYLQEVLK